MSNLLFEILLILALIALNGVLALAETAMVSARRIRLQHRADTGDRGARMALEAAAEPTRFLSTVQIGITLVGIVAGAVGGARIAEPLGELLNGIPLIDPLGGALAMGIVVLAITFLSLVVGELLPKRLALSDPERLASVMAPMMHWLSVLASPVVTVLSASTHMVSRLLGIRTVKDPPITVEEIRLLLEQGEREGVFEATEQDIVDSALHLDDLRASALVTPRAKIVWLDADAPPTGLIATVLGSSHAYFPVGRGSLENTIGIVRGRDILALRVLERPVELSGLMIPPAFVPESQSALSLLEVFKERGHPMALVVDEYGGLVGLVTLMDVMEALVGDIRNPGRGDEVAVLHEEGSWLLDGRLPAREFQALLDLHPPEDTEIEYETLGGLVMVLLGRIPVEGDAVDFAGRRFEVVRMDGRRVDRVRVRAAVEDPG